MQTDRAKPDTELSSLRALPLLLLSLFAAVFVVDLLLAMQPALVRSLRDSWQGSLPARAFGAPWPTLLAASVSFAGIAAGAALLGRFVRIAQTAPYLALAPLLVGFCAVAIGGMSITLPLPLSAPVFACGSALLLIAGGTLFRSESFGGNLAGAFLLATPLALLGGAYLLVEGNSSAAAQPFDQTAQRLMFVLGMASIGTPLIAFAAPRGLRRERPSAADSGEVGEQMVELLERARESEDRALAAERQLVLVGRSAAHTGPQLRVNDDELALLRPKTGAPVWIWAATGVVVALNAAAYFAGYQPLKEKLTATLGANQRLAEQHGAAVVALRADLEKQRAAFEQQLAEAQRPAADLAAVAGAPPAAALAEPGAASRESQGPDESAGVTTGRRSADPEARAAAREARLERAAERAAARADAKAARLAARAERKAARSARMAAAASARTDEEDEGESVARAAKPAAPAAPPAPERNDPGVDQGNDDPLEGLDGL
jgi:hypothetical protein